jgi:hypothetical protein
MAVAVYVRVSTADQNLDRQLERTSEYAQDRLGADLAEIETYRDKSTGTNTERSGYRELMADVEAGEVDHVVVNSISRVSRSIRDLQRTVDRLEDADTALHVVEERLVLDPNEDDPYQDALFRMLGVFAQLEPWATETILLITKIPDSHPLPTEYELMAYRVEITTHNSDPTPTPVQEKEDYARIIEEYLET